MNVIPIKDVSANDIDRLLVENKSTGDHRIHRSAFTDEALFELEHSLAHRLKTKVPRFDDAGVHRPDRYFVDAAALGEQKVVLVIGRGLRLRPAGRGEIPAQGILGIFPRLMAGPAARILRGLL